MPFWFYMLFAFSCLLCGYFAGRVDEVRSRRKLTGRQRISDGPPVYTTNDGVQYVKPDELLKSPAAQRVLKQLEGIKPGDTFQD